MIGSAPDDEIDALVVGGGPAGAAAAIVLARAGARVVVIEPRDGGRPKPCGDVLSPRALTALGRLGVEPGPTATHRIDRVRISTATSSVEVPWPDHPVFGDHALAMRRDRLDDLVLDAAADAGADVLRGFAATSPLVERGLVRGATVRSGDDVRGELRARYVVVADGADSRFGRAIGTVRRPDYPFATAARSYWRSPHHGRRHLEDVVDLVDHAGEPITGYGWVFPLGDGTVNVGVGILSTSNEFGSASPTAHLEAFTRRIADEWSIDPDEPVRRPRVARIPMGASVGPAAGATHLVAGDAAGMSNPWSGAGLEHAYETGTLAAEVVLAALDGDPTELQRYPHLLAEHYGTFFQVGRLADRWVGRPAVARRLGRLAASRRSLAGTAVRFGSNSLRPGHHGPAEVAYRVARAVGRFAPDA